MSKDELGISWEEIKDDMGEDIILKLYDGGFIETIFNSKIDKYRKEGWILKSGVWSPWYLNLRPIGNDPKLLHDIGSAMNMMFREEMPDCNRIVGIEMAGIPIATATSVVSANGNNVIPFCYTRPLPAKVRTPEEADKILKEYGGKELIEGTIESGDELAIWDDMVTNFGSKEIARRIVFYVVEKLGLENVKCDYAAALLDREQGATEQAEKLGVSLHSVIPFMTKGLGWLKRVMDTREFELISDYLNDPKRYEDREIRNKALNY